MDAIINQIEKRPYLFILFISLLIWFVVYLILVAVISN